MGSKVTREAAIRDFLFLRIMGNLLLRQILPAALQLPDQHQGNRCHGGKDQIDDGVNSGLGQLAGEQGNACGEIDEGMDAEELAGIKEEASEDSDDLYDDEDDLDDSDEEDDL